MSKKLWKSCRKVVEKLSESCGKVVEKLSEKLSKNVTLPDFQKIVFIETIGYEAYKVVFLSSRTKNCAAGEIFFENVYFKLKMLIKLCSCLKNDAF
jgi:hypothetical protein